MTDIEDVLRHILFDHEPRASAKAKAVTLADGVEPQALMTAYQPACLQFHHVAGLLTQIATDVVVVVDFPQEADAL